ncbi:hypothetical protein OF83DRAFT_230070 [Amylostereum chailletii]|nr:hypothetical protein OF83DRAFT_230070 [Amylostereum chailletii]
MTHDVSIPTIKDLLGLSPSSKQLVAYLAELSLAVSLAISPTPEVKAYPDAVYFNYFALGISLLFVPTNGYKPKPGAQKADLDVTRLKLDGVDIYNVHKPRGSSDDARPAARSPSNPLYSPYPISPISIPVSMEGKDNKPRPSDILRITPEMLGKEFVSFLGEPERKGGGSGPSSGSIGIWIEWSRDGLMVEFGGDDSRGPQAWDRGKDAIWRVISIFSVKPS